MKKTLTINLAGMVYHIDEDAYSRLKSYLEKLENALKSEAGYTDILSDIEARISELFNVRLTTSRQVVTISDVESVIAVLGNPEVISGHDDSNGADKQNTFQGKSKYRRMYRDPDSRIIGGVASGLAAYWRMDPTIVRVVFVLLTVFGGSGIIIYLVLWILLPEANTTAQKLEMRGEPVTIQNIKQFISDEFENVKKNFRK